MPVRGAASPPDCGWDDAGRRPAAALRGRGRSPISPPWPRLCHKSTEFKSVGASTGRCAARTRSALGVSVRRTTSVRMRSCRNGPPSPPPPPLIRSRKLRATWSRGTPWVGSGRRRVAPRAFNRPHSRPPVSGASRRDQPALLASCPPAGTRSQTPASDTQHFRIPSSTARSGRAIRLPQWPPRARPPKRTAMGTPMCRRCDGGPAASTPARFDSVRPAARPQMKAFDHADTSNLLDIMMYLSTGNLRELRREFRRARKSLAGPGCTSHPR